LQWGGVINSSIYGTVRLAVYICIAFAVLFTKQAVNAPSSSAHATPALSLDNMVPDAKSLPPTAACLAGEARAFIFPQVHLRLYTTLLEPLQAGLFLVLSVHASFSSQRLVKRDEPDRPAWERDFSHLRHTAMPVSAERVRAAARALRPTRLVLMTGETASYSNATMAAIDAWFPGCSRYRRADPTDPLGCDANEPMTSSSDFSCYKTPVCYARLWYALRQQTCLSVIRQHERRVERARGAALGPSSRYRFVFRGRPDLWLPCRLPSIGSVFKWGRGRLKLPATREWALYFYDFATLMTREAADTALKQVPDAAHIAGCRSYEERRVEYCNMCFMQRHNASSAFYASFSPSPAANASANFNTVMDVARSCQLLSQSRTPCTGSDGPDAAVPHSTRLTINETCPIQPAFLYMAVKWLRYKCQLSPSPLPLPAVFVDEYVASSTDYTDEI